MKKIILTFVFLPYLAVAQNLNFGHVEYGVLDGLAVEAAYGESINGYSLGFTSLQSDKMIFNIKHYEATGDWEGGQTSVAASYAFDSFSDGSMYIGIGVTDGDLTDDDEVGFMIGYRKLSGTGTDYGFSATSIDGNVGYSIEVTAANGLTFGLEEATFASTARIGYRHAF